jgi:hypothetical protein
MGYIIAKTGCKCVIIASAIWAYGYTSGRHHWLPLKKNSFGFQKGTPMYFLPVVGEKRNHRQPSSQEAINISAIIP